jgi:hypothetical protein
MTFVVKVKMNKWMMNVTNHCDDDYYDDGIDEDQTVVV